MTGIRVAVLGAGGRGNVYAGYLRRHPGEGAVVAVAEPDEERRKAFAALHGVPAEGQFNSWEQLLEARPEADAIIITTQDRMHAAPTLRALALGYHVLLEKPISPSPAECLAVAEAAERSGRILSVCHVMRYTPYLQAVRNLLRAGRIGKLLSVQWTENVGWWHMAHSFVRGDWRNSVESSPMILAKSCHDMDAIAWLVDAECERVSSFGSLSYFRPERAPAGAAKRCTDNCEVEPDCPYSARKIYMEPVAGWLARSLTADPTPEGRLRALQEGPYGRCVFHCDNDVVDHQVVNLEFAGGVTASFTMTGFTRENTRTFKLFGTEGEIRGHMERNEIEVNDFRGRQEVIRPSAQEGGHNGGDDGLMRSFLSLVRVPSTAENLSPANLSAQTHLIAFAAEESRLTARTVELRRYVEGVQRSVRAPGV